MKLFEFAYFLMNIFAVCQSLVNEIHSLLLLHSFLANLNQENLISMKIEPRFSLLSKSDD